MPRLPSPCIVCGVLCQGTRCPTCSKADERMRIRQRKHSRKASPKERGYDSAWQRLSLRARQQQPFCSDCGATEDLQCDHSPEAWKRHDAGLPLRLRDVDVVCGKCNRRRGDARGRNARSESKTMNNQTVAGTHGQ